MDNTVLVSALIVASLSIVLNIFQYVTSRQMVSQDIAKLLAENISLEAVRENSQALSNYLLTNNQQWDNVFAYLLMVGEDIIVEEIEDLQKNEDELEAV